MTGRTGMSRTTGAGLRRRVDLALVGAGVVVVIALAGAIAAVATVRDRQVAVTEVYFEALTEADSSYVHLVDAETAVRGYLLTADPVTLEPYDRLGDRMRESHVEELLADVYADDDEIMLAREQAVRAAGTWYGEFAEPAIARVEAEGVGAVPLTEIEQGRVLFDQVRVEVEEYRALVAAERATAIASLRSASTALTVTVAILAFTAAAGGVLLWVFLRRWVLDPLTDLAADARRVADGETDHQVRSSGPAEVGQVGRDVEEMRRQLVHLVRDAAAARAALEDSHARLEEQTEDLARSNRDLEQFAYVASHDLQEPLRKVASFTQLLAKRYEGQLDERADQYIAYAVDGAKRMQRLINDLLGFSRVGRIGGELTAVDMGTVLDQVRSDLQETIEETGATVTGDGLPTVTGEEPLLTQLVQNLVGNALKFRHPERAPEVRVTATELDEGWEFACADNGIGIDPQYADRVFVIFQRLHAKDVYEGTGIGLALCKKIIEYHGGDIWIDADVSEGTTIRWRLPAPAAEPAPVPTGASAHDGTGQAGHESGRP